MMKGGIYETTSYDTLSPFLGRVCSQFGRSGSGSDKSVDLVIYDEDHCDDRVFKNALTGMDRLSWMGHLCPDCKAQFLNELAKMMAQNARYTHPKNRPKSD